MDEKIYSGWTLTQNMGCLMSCRNFFSVILVLFFIGAIGGCCFRQQGPLPAPSTLPDISRAMMRPGFWIGQHPHPDDIIMKPEDILALNRYVEKELALNRNITELASTYSGKQFVSAMEKRLLKQGRKTLFFQDGRHADERFYDSIRQTMNLETVPREIFLRHGIVTGYTHQRVLPTRSGLYANPDSLEFDLLQNSGLDMGTVLAVIHESLDGRWYYILSPLSSGWVEASRMAFCSQDQLKAFDRPDPFVVVTAAKADIYLDSELTTYYDSAWEHDWPCWDLRITWPR